MSLDWQMPENSDESLLTYKTRYNGEEHEIMHPVLHCLIFLTLSTDIDYETKNLKDAKRRIKWIKRLNPRYLTLIFGKDALKVEVWYKDKWISFKEYWENTGDTTAENNNISQLDKLTFGENAIEIDINDKWIEKYKGLWTNVGHKTFQTWFNRYNKFVLAELERQRS
jgi:hypothetical protein